LKSLKYSDVTPQDLYINRRKFVQAIGLTSLASFATPLSAKQNYSTLEKPNTFEEITNYNNFYEFGTSKTDPAKYAHNLTTNPWEISFEGISQNKKIFDIAEILKGKALQERVYRLRCVEGWSMVIPWIGFPLANLIKRADPTGSARFVAFETLADKSVMPGINNYYLGGGIDYPYVEGLRLDEAMHPLTILAVGLYGKSLPGQNGAPVRLVVPWKYGFKSAKAIVNISFVEKMPTSSWMKASPNEYGFDSNVNPNVAHPRWSQATERVIGENVFAPRIQTLMFNGYGDEVASLYDGMDLRKNY